MPLSPSPLTMRRGGQPGEVSPTPSFAQTGAELDLDDSDELFSYLDEDAVDLVSEVGGSETYQLRSARSRSRSPLHGRESLDDGSIRRRPSTAASFQLYTPDEDIAVRRKFDRKLVLFVALLYMLAFLDRSSKSSYLM